MNDPWRRPSARFGDVATLAIVAMAVAAVLGGIAGSVVPTAFEALPAGDGKDRVIVDILFTTLGVALGAISGLWFAVWRHAREHPRFHRAIAATALLAWLAGAALFVGLATAPDTRGPPPIVSYEIRLPADATAPDRPDQVNVTLWSGRTRHAGHFPEAWRRRDGDRIVIAGLIALTPGTAHPSLVLSMPGQPARRFHLNLPYDAAATASFSPWRRVDDARHPGDSDWHPAPASDPTDLRFRVLRD